MYWKRGISFILTVPLFGGNLYGNFHFFTVQNHHKNSQIDTLFSFYSKFPFITFYENCCKKSLSLIITRTYDQQRVTTSHSFFNYFLLIFQISIAQWLNCRNLKYELNRSYNGGGVVYVLKARHLNQHDSILLLHHYKSDFAHISDLYSLVIGMYKSEIWAKNN